MTFLQYLREQKSRYDPVGDLARDAFTAPDPDMPRGTTTREQWQLYLQMHRACDGAMDALDDAWDEYDALMGVIPGRYWDEDDDEDDEDEDDEDDDTPMAG